MKPAILLVGAGGHAQSCIDVIEQEGKFEIAGVVGMPGEVGAKVLGYQVLGTDDDLPELHEKIQHAIISVGQIKTAGPRERIFRRLAEIGFAMPLIISPRAYVSRHARLGQGTIVMHGATVNAGAVIGRNCIINSHALIEHGAKVEDYCHIATAAVVNGDATIGEGAFLGSRAVVRESINIGRRCLIGMGQAVFTDCPDETHIPARKDLS